MVINPWTSGYRSRNPASSAGSTPDFDSSPERFTSTSAGIVRRRAADYAAGATMGEVLARPARGADVGALHRSHAGVVERALRSRPQVEVSATDDGGAERCPVSRADLVSDLVAARADPRADHCRGRTSADRADARCADPFGQAQPA